jgi:hypothetical protein
MVPERGRLSKNVGHGLEVLKDWKCATPTTDVDDRVRAASILGEPDEGEKCQLSAKLVGGGRVWPVPPFPPPIGLPPQPTRTVRDRFTAKRNQEDRMNLS